MTYFKNLAKIVGITILMLLGISFLNTILYYFDIISSSVSSVIKLITPLISFFLGSYLLGKKAEKKGFLEGLKLGGILILFFLIVSILTKHNFSIKMMFYYFILLFTASVGGMAGINRKKEN